MAYHITDTCIGCGACVKKCPVMAISGNRKEVHVIKVKRCVDCGVCQNICPKGAILDARGVYHERQPKNTWPKPIIDTDACSACSLCVSSCILGCLAISAPTFKGDLGVFAALPHPEACTGCRQCEIICPLKAIHMEVPDENS